MQPVPVKQSVLLDIPPALSYPQIVFYGGQAAAAQLSWNVCNVGIQFLSSHCGFIAGGQLYVDV